MGDRATELAEGVARGDRRSLSKAITLVESTRASDAVLAGSLLDLLLDRTGESVRIGISGTPGAGKSTFINALGLRLIKAGLSVAVLAIDPSSQRTGGSILGDKTRMAGLSAERQAYIRPSPAGSSLGGITTTTRESLLLCEAAGFDVVIVETVGVGQSEAAAASITDLFVLLINPGSGDDLQGIKRGVLEVADLVIVNKADGDLRAAAERTAADHRLALMLMRPRWRDIYPEVMTTSAIEGTGLDEAWQLISDLHSALRDRGDLAIMRSQQAVEALWTATEDAIRRQLVERGRSLGVTELEAAVGSGTTSVRSASLSLMRTLSSTT